MARVAGYFCLPACGDKCANQFTDMTFNDNKLEVFRLGTPGINFGIRAATNIKRGEFVDEHVGEYMSGEDLHNQDPSQPFYSLH